MKKQTYFMNNGHFDIRAMMTFGVSVKDDSSAIGYFGTGFKYAVAIILRLGGEIKVTTMGEVFNFTVSTETIRGKEFGVVKCNGKDAGFTTRMGINWEPWMAYRELRCNATDEGGVVDTEAKEFDTVIEVTSIDILNAHHNADMHFISGSVIGEHSNVEVYDRQSKFVYYQGVAVFELPRISTFSYNIKTPIDLTEDRTAKYSHQISFAVQRCMQQMTDAEMVSTVLDDNESYESAIGFDQAWGCSDEFIKVAIEKQATDKGVPDSVVAIVQKHIDANCDWPSFELSKIQQAQYKKALVFLSKIDIDIERFKVNFVTGLGHGVMGRAHKGEIFITDMPFNMGTKQLASTLIEEWVHLKTGCHDFDRTMQNWLFDKIMSLAEVISGEPV